MDPNTIAFKAIQQYNKLPKKGKPNVTSEWTTMAAIIQEQKTDHEESVTSNLKVISIGTGTKCLGEKELSGLGDVVSDSHSEIIARRSFKLYLYEQVKLCKTGRSDKSILEYVNSADKSSIIGNLKLRNGISFHMFVSHLPCGDAAIIDKANDKEDNLKDNDANDSCPPTKKPKTEEAEEAIQEHRTGAKLQVGPLRYEEMQTTGKCRVKPGKGDPTLCMSCSDKLAKWQILGLQGSLLSVFIVEPIRLHSVTIGGGVSFSVGSLERALYTRFADLITNKMNNSSFLDGYKCPQVYQSDVNFMKLAEDLSPAPASISWYYSLAVVDPSDRETVQVLVGGRKQGSTKKYFGKPSSMVDICRIKIFSRFKDMYIANKKSDTNEPFKTYADAKSLSKEYVTNWTMLKENVFQGWTDKPQDLKLFI